MKSISFLPAMALAAFAFPAFAEDYAPDAEGQPQSATPEANRPATPASQPADTGGLGQEIVVTAQRRAENVQDVPIAVSAFTSQALTERAVTSVAALSNITPNVTLDASTPFSGSTSVLSAFIRGIGANDFAFNIDPGVGVYLDGVYLARSVGANQDLPDVERVEVLKGPQGTLFGRNTIGGAISIVTHDPGDRFRFVGDVTTGSYHLIFARGTVDIPLAKGLSSSIAFSIKNRQGYLKRIPFPGMTGFVEDPVTAFKAAGYENIGLGREGGDNIWTLRGKLRWDDGGSFRATLSADYQNEDQEQVPNKLLATTPSTLGGAFDVFAGTYNCAIRGVIAVGTECGGGPPSFSFIPGRAGHTGLYDNPSIFGVNVDANTTNNRLPYDNRFLIADKDESYANGNNFSKLKDYGLAGTAELDVSPDVTLKSITAYRELHWRVGMDLDGSPLNFLHTSFIMNQWQFSEELQLLGKALDDKLHYVFGAYYFKEAGNLHDFVTFAEGLLQIDGPNNLETENYAGFGQVDWRISDLIGITLGGRYTHENKSFEGFQSDLNGLTYKILQFVGVPPCASLTPITEACRIAAGFPNPGQPLRYYIAGVNHKSFSNFSPKVGVQIHPTDRVMIYGSWSEGYKTGGWTTRLSNPLNYAPDFDEEHASTFELGLKSELFDRHLQLNVAAFHTDYRDIQLNFQLGVSPTIQNAGNARISGFELESVIAPLRGLTLNAAIGYLDAQYTSVLPGAVVNPNPLQAGVFKGADLPKTPHWKISFSPRYEFALGNGGRIILLGDWSHSTRLRNDTEGTFLLERPTVDLINASIAYEAADGHWSLTAGGTNLTDERYIVNGQAQIAGGQIYGTYNRPAEWYVRLGIHF